MDSQKRRRQIVKQTLKLEELKGLRDKSPALSIRTSKSRLQRTEHSLSVPQKKEVLQDQQIDDIMQKSDCKLIFLQNNQDQLGFKTFSDMMRTNSSWLLQAPKLNPQVHTPSQLQNRLHFNQTQANKFKLLVEKKWNRTVNEVAETLIQKQDSKHLPKVKLVTLKINHNEVEEDNYQEDTLTPAMQESAITNNSLKCFWFQLQVQGWKPPIREGCTVSYFPKLRKCIMYGGIGNDLFKSFITLNTMTWVWKDNGIGNGDIPLDGRFGHTANIYKDQLIIYGGEKKYNPALKMRECYSDIRLYIPSDQSWILNKTSGDQIEGRRNHIAQVVGKYFIIYAGVNSYGKVLNDVCGLNLETFKWNSYLVDHQCAYGVQDATSYPLFKGDVKMENPYFSYECVKKKGKYSITVSLEGIYVFGGRLQNGEATNDLRIIQFGTKPLKCIKAKAKGIPPSARYSHSMNYYKEINALIIYGGRNDAALDTNGGNIFNDIHVYLVEQCQWVQIQQVGQLKDGKCNHSSVIIDSKIMIFGGYNANLYAGSDIQLIELDQNKVGKMIKDNKTLKNKDLIIQSQDLITNSSLKVYKTEHYNEADDPEVKQRKIQENEIQRLSYGNFRSFMPIPHQATSALVSIYKAKKEQTRCELLRQQQTIILTRNNSRRTLTISDDNKLLLSRQVSKTKLEHNDIQLS